MIQTGRDLFEATRDLALCLEHPWPCWEELSAEDKAEYELMAFEVDAQDREVQSAHTE